MTPPPPPPLPARPDATTVALRMRDFPARFSPMLVKELRQGMRTNLFTVAFILLQTVMVLSLLAGVADPGSSAVDAFFWFFIVTTLLIVQPLRGFNALSAEYSLNTMDLIQLTRLDAWRITLGKWTALNAQTLLFLTGVLPYLVMRYFLGNVNFVLDLTALLFLGLGSGLASAIVIGCSAFRHFVLRGILVLAFGIGFALLYGVLHATLVRRGGFGTGDVFATMGLSAVAMSYGCFFFLAFGASRIAPLSENHATRKRLFALGFAALGLVFGWFGGAAPALIVVGLILGFACIDALTEPIPVYARVLEPFQKNVLARIAAFFLAPGWLSGLGFFFLCSWVWLAAVSIRMVTSSASGAPVVGEEPVTMLAALLSSVNLFLFPLIFIHLLFPKHASDSFTFGVYTFIQGCLATLTIMAGALGNALPSREELIYLAVPAPSVLLMSFENSLMEDKFPLAALGIAMVTFVLGIAVPLLRQREVVRDFLRHLKKPV